MKALKTAGIFFVMAISWVGGAVGVLIIFTLLSGTEFGYNFVYHFTGGLPDIAAVIAGCVASFFASEFVAEKVNGYEEVKSAAKLVIGASIIFAILNVVHFSLYDLIKNAITLFYGWTVYKIHEFDKNK